MAGKIQGLHRITEGCQGLGQARKGDAVAADAMDTDEQGPRPAHRAPMPASQGAITPDQWRGVLIVPIGIGLAGDHRPMMESRIAAAGAIPLRDDAYLPLALAPPPCPPPQALPSPA